MARRIVDHQHLPTENKVIESDALNQVLQTLAPELLNNGALISKLIKYVDPAKEPNPIFVKSIELQLKEALHKNNRPNLADLIVTLNGMRHFARQHKAQNLQMLDESLVKQEAALLEKLNKNIQVLNFQKSKKKLHTKKY